MKSFSMSDKEERNHDAWWNEHKKKCKLFKKGKPRHNTYKFTPTGMDLIIEVRCSCGKEINVTDSESW